MTAVTSSWPTRYDRLHRGRHCILVTWYTINGKCRCFLGVTFMFLAWVMHFNFLMMLPWWKQNFVPNAQNPETVSQSEPRLPGGGYSSSSRAGRLGRTLWPQNSTSVAETEKGGQNSTMTPPTLEKGGQYSTSVGKVCKKGGQKYTILKNIGVKILQVWKWGSKFYMLKNRGQNSTMLEKRGVNILHPTPKVEVKILHRLKKGGQKGRAYPLPKI